MKDRRKQNDHSSGKGLSLKLASEPTKEKITVGTGTNKPYRKGERPYDARKQDASWYSKNEQITKDVTNLPFPWKNGLSYPVTYTPFAPAGNTNFAVPSVLAYAMAVTLGGAKSSNTLNTIANNLYAWVRYANSGSRNYESPDLFMYLGAIVTPYAIASHITKCIGLTNVASAVNRAYPRQVFDAMGIDYNDAISNIAQYRGRLNRLIVRLNAYNVPKNLSIFASAIWGFSGVFIESENAKDQLYVAYPSYGMEFDATHPNGSALKLVAFGRNSFQTIGDWLNELEREILILETDEDIGIISGDLLKVAGDAGIYQLSQVPEDFMVFPTFSEDILFKFKNVRCFPRILVSGVNNYCDLVGKSSGTGNPWALLNSYVYYQESLGLGLANQIVQSLGMATPSTVSQINNTISGTVNLIDTKSISPTMDEINEDVAFKFSLNVTPNTTDITPQSVFEIENAGMFICTEIFTYSVEANAATPISNDIIFHLTAYTNTFLNDAPALLGMFSNIRAFKYTFANLHLVLNTPGGYQYQNQFSGDFTNVHLLTMAEEVAIFDQQLLSMFSVPARDHLGKALAYKQ